MSLAMLPTSIPVMLTSIGLIVLIYGFYIAFRVRNTLGSGDLAEAWNKLLGLIALFIVGYITYLAQLISGNSVIDPEMVTAGIFLGGSIFVAVVARLNYGVFSPYGDSDDE